MKNNTTASSSLPLKASTPAVLARGDKNGNHAGYKHECNTISHGCGSLGDETMLKSFGIKTRIYSILAAFLVSTLLTGCYVHPHPGVGIYVPPVGVNVYAPPPHYVGPHHRPHHWRRHRPRHWH